MLSITPKGQDLMIHTASAIIIISIINAIIIDRRFLLFCPSASTNT